MFRKRPLLIATAVGVALGVIALIGREFAPRQSPMSAGVVFDGYVMDQFGTVPGAHVRFLGSTEFAVTGTDGGFTLILPTKPMRITAWRAGYRIGAIDSDAALHTIFLYKLPAEDNADYLWVNPHESHDAAREEYGQQYRNDCLNCHDHIFNEWLSSPHSRAFEKPSRFREMFFGLGSDGKTRGWGLIKERPDGEQVCASCHNPAPAMAQPALSAESKVSSGGIHCDFCHKIVGGAGEIGLTHGKYGFEFLRPKNWFGQVFYGPLEDSSRDVENTYSPFQKSSQLCASCHEGVVFGVRAYETYSEWQMSPAGRAGVQCQQCHMKPTGKMTNIAPGHDGVERDPMTLANHSFFDGSHRDMLKNCVRLSLDVTPTGKAVVQLSLEGVGHRVPTGLPDRNLTLVVETFDSDGKALRQEKKVFAKVLKDFEGRSPAPFWRAAPEFDDNRLTPGKPERLEFSLPASTAKVTAKLVYRKFWPEVTREKGWPDDAWLVAEATSATP
jgi:hypothetical protein